MGILRIFLKKGVSTNMILKYRTTSFSSPPHTSFSYIDNISHFSPSYNPLTSTLTVNLTIRTPYHVPTSLVLNDLAFLLTDEGKFLDKVFDPNSSNSQNPQSSSYPSYHQKPYKPYNKPYYKKPYYNSKPSSDFPSKDSVNSDSSDSSDSDE